MKPDLIKICPRSALPAVGEVKEVFASGRFFCVANVDGEICVMDNVCPHWGGPLGRGKIVQGRLVCPWHGWTFNPMTGETPNKAQLTVAVHKTIVEGEDLFVELAQGDACGNRALTQCRNVGRQAPTEGIAK